MENTQQAYLTLARSNEEVIVEIFRPPPPPSDKESKGLDQHQNKGSTNKNVKIDDGLPLIKFSIPWRTRVQSSYLSHPPGSHVPTVTTPTTPTTPSSRDRNNNNSRGSGSYVRRGSNAIHNNNNTSTSPYHSPPLLASIFDPWKGFDSTRPGVWTRDRMYMCVPGTLERK